MVPAEYRGLWRRRLLETPEHTDRSTLVYWLQTGSLYADLRIPAVRAQDDPQALARQQGFAGSLKVDGDRLTWERWLDFQPSVSQDVGRVHFEGEVLIEQGVHATYREEWERVQDADADCVALSLEAELDERGRQFERRGVLVACGDYFLFALDRRWPLPPAANLSALLGNNRFSSEEKSAFLNCAIDFGVRGPDGVWHVRYSTLPAHERRNLSELHGGWQRDGLEHCLQSHAGGVFRRWRMVEWGAAFRGLPQAAP